jgi:hypothetical protein
VTPSGSTPSDCTTCKSANASSKTTIRIPSRVREGAVYVWSKAMFVVVGVNVRVGVIA